jgi:hypothetical protein
MFQKLGNAYYFNGNSKKAQWYGELFAMTLRSNQLIIIYPISAFHRRNDKADQIMEKFDQISGIGELLQKKTHGCHSLIPEGIKSKMRINSPIQIMELCDG